MNTDKELPQLIIKLNSIIKQTKNNLSSSLALLDEDGRYRNLSHPEASWNKKDSEDL